MATPSTPSKEFAENLQRPPWIFSYCASMYYITFMGKWLEQSCSTQIESSVPFITICQINEYPACPTPTPYSAEDKDYLHIEIEMGGGRGCLVDETGKPDNMLSIYSLITSSLITRTKKD